MPPELLPSARIASGDGVLKPAVIAPPTASTPRANALGSAALLVAVQIELPWSLPKLGYTAWPVPRPFLRCRGVVLLAAAGEALRCRGVVLPAAARKVSCCRGTVQPAAACDVFRCRPP